MACVSRGVGLALVGMALACGHAPPATGSSGTSGGDADGTTEPTSEGGSDAAAEESWTIVVLGLPLGGTVDEVRAAVPEAVVEPNPEDPGAGVAEFERPLEGATARGRLQFRAGRLYSAIVWVSGPAATTDQYEAWRTRAVADLGAGTETRCESEDGVPFEEYLRHGQGSLGTSWHAFGGRVSGNIELRGAIGGAEDLLQLGGSFWAPSLAPPVDDTLFDDIVQGELSACREGPAVPVRADVRNRRAPPAASAKQAEECTVDLSGQPGATVLGLPFGAPRPEVERMIGSPLEDLGLAYSFGREVEGLPARVQLSFYAGCLAVVIVVVEGDAATADAYRTLRQWARGFMGPGDAVRCTEAPTDAAGGTPTDEDGLRATIWRGATLLEGGLRLDRPTRSPEGRSLVFEASYLPLRPYAPHYDFDGSGLAGGETE